MPVYSHRVAQHLRSIDYKFQSKISHLIKIMTPSPVSDFASVTLLIRTAQYLEFSGRKTTTGGFT